MIPSVDFADFLDRPDEVRELLLTGRVGSSIELSRRFESAPEAHVVGANDARDRRGAP